MISLNRSVMFSIQYQLDYPPFGFALDEKDRSIYGVTVDREPNLVRFDY